MVAVLEDEPKLRKALRRLLVAHGLHVEDYGRGDEVDLIPGTTNPTRRSTFMLSSYQPFSMSPVDEAALIRAIASAIASCKQRPSLA